MWKLALKLCCFNKKNIWNKRGEKSTQKEKHTSVQKPSQAVKEMCSILSMGRQFCVSTGRRSKGTVADAKLWANTSSSEEHESEPELPPLKGTVPTASYVHGHSAPECCVRSRVGTCNREVMCVLEQRTKPLGRAASYSINPMGFNSFTAMIH